MHLIVLVLHSLLTAQSPARDTVPRIDTLKSQLLKAATVSRQTPLIQHQLDKTVLNVDHQVTAAGSNALELLRQLPGVQITPDGQITLNGRNGVTVLIDGKPTYLSAEDLAAQLTATPSAAIQQLELMTNPSAKYDAEGTGGIINIVRKRNRAEGLNGSFTGTVGEGNYPRYNGNLLISYKTAHYNLYLSNSYNYNKTLLGGSATADIYNGNALLTQQVSTNDRTNTGRADNSTAGIDWYLSQRTTLSLTGNLGARSAGELITSSMNVLDGNGKATGTEIFSGLNTDHPENYTTGIQLNHRLDTLGQEWSVDADYSEFHYRPAQYNASFSKDAAGDYEDQSDVFLAQSRDLQIIGARVDYVRPWLDKGKLEAGLKTSYVKTVNNSSYFNQLGGQNFIDSTQSDYNLNTENINAAYFNVSREFKRLTLQAGLRAEQSRMQGKQLYANLTPVDQRYFQLFPSLFADFKLDARNNLNIQLGRRIDRSDYHELVPFRRPLSPTLYFEGNPYLKPSLTWHGEITWAWRNTVFATFGYDIDKNYVRTLPYLDANDSTATRIPTNIQGSHSWNLDLSFNHPLTRWWTTNTTASFYQNSFTGSAVGFNLSNPGIVSLDFTSNNTLTVGKNLSGEIDFEHETKRQFVQSTFGAYSILSFGLRQQLPGKKATLSLNVHNILQTEKVGSANFYLNLDQYTNTLIYSRAITVTLNYRFGSGKPTQTKRRSGSADEQQRAGD